MLLHEHAPKIEPNDKAALVDTFGKVVIDFTSALAEIRAARTFSRLPARFV
jgi:hypothetical protein